jgi:ATP-dependent Lhr-like helicase
MAKRKFREIAAIAGLIFQGYPGKAVKTRHLQASSSLLFEVIREHEPKSLLIRQAYQEALDQQLEEQRLRNCLKRLSGLEILLKQTERPSPLAFPILVDRFREQLTSEKMEDRINRLLGEYKKSGDAEGQKTKSERKPKRRNAK